jgi:hypothetical protein
MARRCGEECTQRLELVSQLSPTSVDPAYAMRLCGVHAAGVYPTPNVSQLPTTSVDHPYTM